MIRSTIRRIVLGSELDDFLKSLHDEYGAKSPNSLNSLHSKIDAIAGTLSSLDAKTGKQYASPDARQAEDPPAQYP